MANGYLFIDPQKLNSLADQLKGKYQQGPPFPHIVMDNFLPPDILRKVVEEFSITPKKEWIYFDSPEERKYAIKTEAQIGPSARQLIYELNGSSFLLFLERLTGVQGLIPDPHLRGGGFHSIERGGFLAIHADFNRYEQLRLDRRVNLLLYLNENWKEEYGGHLELWDRDMKKCEQKVLPIFNRCVVFSSTSESYHGHPDPLQCPEGMTRKSLALYYYTNGRPSDEVHVQHGTLHQKRPYDIENEKRPSYVAKKIVKKLVPPIFLDVFHGVKKILSKKD